MRGKKKEDSVTVSCTTVLVFGVFKYVQASVCRSEYKTPEK